MDRTMEGYWPSPWPAEDGGPARRQVPHPRSDGRPGEPAGPWLAAAPAGDTALAATARELWAPTMAVLRDPGEVFVVCHTLGPVGTSSWLERIDPATLEPVDRSPDLPGGPFWPGGVAAHANGSLYVTYGRWCHRLGPDCSVLASRELPRDRPYNSLVVLPDGHLVMKDIGGGAATGQLALPDGVAGSELVVLEPEGLEVVERLELDQGSVARLSMQADDRHPDGAVYVVGVDDLLRLVWDPSAQRLGLDHAFTHRYRTANGQGFGWDVVLTDDAAWFLDDGAGTEAFGPSLRGKGIATAPLRLWRVPLDVPADASDAGTRGVEALEVCGLPGGVIANPPAIDQRRGVAVGYDSGNAVVTAWRFGEPGTASAPLWTRSLDHAGHPLLLADAGLLLLGDFDHEAGAEALVALDVETGEERGRTVTGSPLQSVLFPAPGWDDDVYTCTFTTLARVHP
ncbi:MAG: hypothetical protein U0Q07_04435 [Acidimicrobiales bacterium]